MKKLVTTRELAKATGYSTSGIYSMIARGELKRVPGIRNVRFDPEYLNRKFGLDFGRESKKDPEISYEEYAALKRENAELRGRLDQIRVLLEA